MSARCASVWASSSSKLSLFPHSQLFGWKYELTGTRDEALTKVRRQLAEAHTDYCVLNGRAAGEGFTLCDPTSTLTHAPSKADLCAALVALLAQHPPISGRSEGSTPDLGRPHRSK